MRKALILLLLVEGFVFNSPLAQIAPLISTAWDQGCFYNADCPVTPGGPCGKAWAGCNATAVAQICKYYSYPVKGMGYHCNKHDTSHCVDFSIQSYSYSSMPDHVTSPNAEVAKLMYHLGIALDMQWGATASYAVFDQLPLKRYFVFSPRMYATATYLFDSIADLENALKAELDGARPVFAMGGSHFYIIDGYDSAGLFHCNFGWSGTYNGYYGITSVVNGAGNFTPTLFQFFVRPLSGDLETGADTIEVKAYSMINAFEFTSLLNWTMTSPTPWLTIYITSGMSGYITYGDGGKFSTTQNNGGTRFGYIYIQNPDDTDTIVIRQEASPLQVRPDSLVFPYKGGSTNDSVTFFSYSTWKVTTPDNWISLAPGSGTGSGIFTVTCSENPDTSARNGFIVLKGGVFTDTIPVHQEAKSTIGIGNEKPAGGGISIFPVPADSYVFINVSDLKIPVVVEIFSSDGRRIRIKSSNDPGIVIETGNLENGVYFVMINSGNTSHASKFMIFH